MNLRLRQIVLPLAGFTLSVDTEITSPVTAICGPSGAGKTSLLDLIAGLRHPESAYIQLDDRVLTHTATATFVPARHRHMGYLPRIWRCFPTFPSAKTCFTAIAGKATSTPTIFLATTTSPP